MVACALTAIILSADSVVNEDHPVAEAIEAIVVNVLGGMVYDGLHVVVIRSKVCFLHCESSEECRHKIVHETRRRG